MANNTDKGFNIKISADTTDFSKSLREVRKEGRDLRRELGNIEKGLKFDPKNTQLMANKIGAMKDQIKNTGKELEYLKKQQEAAKKSGKDLTDPAGYRKLTTNIERISGILKTQKEELEKIDKTKKNAFDFKATGLEGIKAKLRSIRGSDKTAIINFKESGLSNIGSSFKSVFSSIKNGINNIDTSITGMVNKTGDKLQSLGKKMKGFGDTLSSYGNKLSIGITAPSLIIGKKAFESAAEYEDSLGAIDAVFKDSASSLKDWANQLPSYYGIARRETLQYGTIMGSLLKNIGSLSDEEASKMSQKLVELAGDMRAMFGGTTQDAVNSLTQALKGNYATLDNYGMGITAATVTQRALAETGKETSKSLTQQEKQAAALSLIFEQSADFAGRAKKEAKNAGSIIQSVSINLETLKEKIGESLIRTFEKPLDTFNKFTESLKNMSDESIDKATKMAGMAVILGPSLKIFGLLTSSFGKGAESIGKFLSNFGGIKSILNPLNLLKGSLFGLALGFGSLLLKDVDKENLFTSLKEKAKSFIDFLKPVVKNVKSMVTKIVDTFEGVASKHIGKISEKFKKVLENFKSIKGDGIFNSILNGLAGLADNVILPVFEKILDFLGSDTFSSVIQWTIDTFGKLFETLSDIANNINLQPISDWFSGLFNGENTDKFSQTLQSIFGYIKDTVIPALKETISVIKEQLGPSLSYIWEEVLQPLWEEHLKPFLESLFDLIETLSPYIKKIFDFIIEMGKKMSESMIPAITIITDLTGKLFGVLLDIGKWVLDAIKWVLNGGISNMFDKIAEFFEGIGQSIEDFDIKIHEKINTGVQWIKDTINGFFESIKETGKNIYESVTGFFSRLADPVIEKINWMKDKWQEFKDMISSGFSLPKIKVPHISVDWQETKIPGLSIPDINVDWYDKGGIFTSPQVIGVGEKRPEVVGALEDIKTLFMEAGRELFLEYSKNNGNNTSAIFNIYDPVVKDEKDMKRLFDKMWQEMQRRNKQRW